MTRTCDECVFVGRSKLLPASKVCEYPVPYHLLVRGGGGFVSGYEAEECATFKTKADVVAAQLTVRASAENGKKEGE